MSKSEQGTVGLGWREAAAGAVVALAVALVVLAAGATSAFAWGIDASASPHNVDCDGTDETAGIQSALDAANVPGDTVLLPPGDCGVSSPLKVKYGGTVLQGSGAGHRDNGSQDAVGTRITPLEGTWSGSEVIRVQAVDAKGDESRTVVNGGCYGDCEPLYGVSIRDLAVDVDTDEDGAPSSVDAVYWRSSHGLLQSVKVYHATDDGIRFRGYTAAEAGNADSWNLADQQVFNVQAEKSTGDGMLLEDGATDMQFSQIIVSDGSASGLHFAGGGSEQITTSHLYDNADYDVFFDGSGSRTKITNSKIEGAGKHGVYFNSCTSAPADVQLIGNNFADNGDSSPGTYSHVYLQSSADCGGSSPARATRLQINGNNFTSKSGAVSPDAKYALRLGSATGGRDTSVSPSLPEDEAVVQGNAFGKGHTTTAVLDLASSASVVFTGNSGLKTEGGDVAKSVTDAGGDKTVNIPHSLAVKPTAVSALPADAATAALGAYYVSSVTSSNIVLTYTGAANVPAATYLYAISAAVR